MAVRDTGLYAGYSPGLPGAHSQGATLGELSEKREEVLDLLFEAEDGGQET